MTLAQRKESAWNAVLAVSLVAIVLAGWVALLKRPEPRQSDQRLASIHVATQDAVAEAKKALAAIELRASGGSHDALASGTLSRLTLLAEKQNLTLSSFRAERPAEVAGLTQVPFVAVVDGKFEAVMALLDRIEAPDSKLAVEMLQMQGSESNPGGVTATLSLVSFLVKESKS